MTIDILKIADRFQTIFTGRKGTVKETGVNVSVTWDSYTIERYKLVDGERTKVNETVPAKTEIISSKTEVEKI